MGVLVLPLVEFEAAFHQERTPLLHVLGHNLGLPAKGVHINKRHLFFGLASLALPFPIDGKTEGGDGCAFGRVAQFGVAG